VPCLERYARESDVSENSINWRLDLHIVSPRLNVLPRIPPRSNLQFLSLIEVSKVPLYLSAGPSLEVWTGDCETAEWIEGTLSRSLDGRSDQINGPGTWWKDGVGSVQQSQVGVLLQVNDQREQQSGQSGHRITEIVLYGISSKLQLPLTPPSPPPSSSPGHGVEVESGRHELEVYALPISSDLLYTPLNTNIQSLGPPSPPSDDSKQLAQFLPTQHSPLKRKRAAVLLDDAIKRRKNIQRKGGDGVGLLVTGGITPKPPVSIKKEALGYDTPVLSPIDTSFPSGARFGLKSYLDSSPAEPSSRQGSITSNPVNDRVSSLSRPPSRKRSSLHRLSSSISLGAASPLLPPESSDSITEQNKSLLSRIVLAGMRLYSLSRNKERPMSASGSVADTPTGFGNEDLENKEVDDFKGVYHATYRAASFAMRKSMKGNKLLERETMRNVVDQLLSLFCEDRDAEGSTG
jgi:hypothetical protein